MHTFYGGRPGLGIKDVSIDKDSNWLTFTLDNNSTITMKDFAEIVEKSSFTIETETEVAEGEGASVSADYDKASKTWTFHFSLPRGPQGETGKTPFMGTIEDHTLKIAPDPNYKGE